MGCCDCSSFCVLTRCCGLNLHAGMRASLIYVMIVSVIALSLVILDLVSIKHPELEQMGEQFFTPYRSHINDVMEWLDGVMIFSHIIIFILAIITFIVSRNEDTKLNVCMLTFFAVMMWAYILIDFAVNMYYFTWMNHNIFTMPMPCFLWLFWITRTIFNALTAVMAHSRIIDLKYQKKYDLLNMPGVNHSLTSASVLSSSMRSVAGKEHIRAISSQQLYASRHSLHQSQRSLNRSQQSLNRGAANF